MELDKKFQSEEEKQIFINNLIPKLKEILIINAPINNNTIPICDEANNNSVKTEMNNISDKNKEKGLLGVLRSAVDDIGDGLSRAKDTAKNFLSSSNETENQNKALIQEIEQKMSENYFKQIAIFISCISSFYKILKRLIDFTSRIELDFQKNQILEKINKYKKLIEQINYFLFMKISLSLIDFEKISTFILDSDWSPSLESGAGQLFEASFWVSKIINLFEIILDLINQKYKDIFDEKKIVKYLTILIKHILNNIQNNFSKIKNCNDTGRSVMLKDIKFLKQGIENALKKYNLDKKSKINELFDIIFLYINAWYYNSDELTNFIFDNNIQYKHFQSFIYSSPFIIGLSQEKKNQYINEIKQKYLMLFKKIISKLKN